jgi:hypothetical protein
MFMTQQPFCVTSEHLFTLPVGGMLCPFPSWLPFSSHNTIAHCLPFLLSLSQEPGSHSYWLLCSPTRVTLAVTARQQESLLLSPPDNRSHSCCHPVIYCPSYCCHSVCHTLGHSIFPSYIFVEDHCFLTCYSNFYSFYSLKFKKMFLAL